MSRVDSFISLKGCLVTYLFLRAFGFENALSLFFWPSSLRLWKRVKASTRLCSASSLMSFSSFSNFSSGVMFGFAVYRKDFGQVRFVRCSSNSCIECSVFAILFSTVLWSVYFRFRPRFGRLGFGGLLGV